MLHSRLALLARAVLAVAATLALLAVPGTALAATESSDSDVTGVVAANLALSVGTPAQMSLTHISNATSTSLVTVTSTSLSWTLSIRDQDASLSGTPGRMDKVNCVTGALLGGSLESPIEWSGNLGSTYSNLTGTPATVMTGSLVDAKTVTYRQVLGASEDVAAGECYKLRATFTVTDA